MMQVLPAQACHFNQSRLSNESQGEIIANAYANFTKLGASAVGSSQSKRKIMLSRYQAFGRLLSRKTRPQASSKVARPAKCAKCPKKAPQQRIFLNPLFKKDGKDKRMFLKSLAEDGLTVSEALETRKRWAACK